MSDPFPNELVEAAAKAILPHWDHAVESEKILARETARRVLPLIEQRVIDRLAGTENPYAVHRTRDDDGKQIHYLHRGDPADGESGIAHRAWSEGAACGVAAERARCPLCDHEWRRHDPEDGRCDCHSETIIGPCQCGRDLAWMQGRIAAMSCAALAPERTTATEPEGEK